MKIDIGAPSEYGVSGIDKRINKLKNIINIPYGLNLDFGTGVGAYYPVLKRFSKKMYAFDAELSYLKRFPIMNPDDFDKVFISTAEKISLKDGVFDAIFAIEVLEHVKDLEQTLWEINRILKDGGLFFITVPNKYFLLETHMIHFGSFYIKGRYVPFLSMLDFFHNKIGTARRFSKKDILKEFTKSGFEVIGIDYMMPPFDYSKIGEKFIKGISSKIENSILKFFSMTLIAVLRKS